MRIQANFGRLRLTRQATTFPCHETAPLAQKCRLLLLPQVLQDEIFDLAFFNESTAIYINAWTWRQRETERRAKDHTYLAEPFPGPKVMQLLVSKRFFF